ncbi:hypothetical protein [Streptomyces sp. NPDC101166]|uniref:hypothetical protein n=1 Tax=Streptomyces sp. NPDC101166 TaxID=3366120 RepID=UPI0037F822BC
MDIPDWSVWLLTCLAVLQALSLVIVIRRFRRSDPALRSEALLDLLDTFAGLLLFGGMMLSLTVADSFFWLGLVGFAMMTVVYAMKGVRYLQARRRPST